MLFTPGGSCGLVADHAQKPPQMNTLPLTGIRVLDVSHIIAGPFCTMLLANAGAEVIKVEPPQSGERSRKGGRPIGVETDEIISLQYVRVNRGKKDITLNLRDEVGKTLFRRLAAESDVIVENFRPGSMDRLGLGYETLRDLNPGLIYAAISGFGRSANLRGPYSDWPANNPSAQAMSGLMDVTGEPGGPPSLVGASLGDTIPGLWAAYGILLALEHRRKTGRGQFLDIAMYDCMVMHNDAALPFYDLAGRVPGRDREDMWSVQLRLEAADGYVMLSGNAGPAGWERLWRLADRPDLAEDRRFLGEEIDGPFLMRVVRPELEAWTRRKGKKELCILFIELGFSAAMVQTARDVCNCPQLQAREMFHEFEFAGKRFRQPGDPVKLSDVAAGRGTPPPHLGQHNSEILLSLGGLNEREFEELRRKNIV